MNGVFKTVGQTLEMIRFSHTLFAMPFALIAALLAWSAPSPRQIAAGDAVVQPLAHFRWQHLIGILLCMVTARSAAMAFNRIVDRRLDSKNPRTAGRHLPAGALSLASVVGFTIFMSLLFVLSTLLFLPNRWPLILSIPVLGFIGAYSFTKRFTAASHFWLGGSLMLAPLCTWIALRGQWLELATIFDLMAPAWIGVAVLLWVAGFDMIYACQDAEVDGRLGLHSVPSDWGVAAALRSAAICHAMMLLLLVGLPWLAPELRLGWVYLAGVGLIAVLIVIEHSLVRPDNMQKVNLAFFHVNIVVSIGLLVFVALDMVFR